MSVIALRSTTTGRLPGRSAPRFDVLPALAGVATLIEVASPRDAWRRVAATPAAGQRMLGSWVLAVTGQLVIAVGVSLLLRADLGAIGWDTLHAGLAGAAGISVGQAGLITSALCLVIGLCVGWRPTAMVAVAAGVGAVAVDAVVDVLPVLSGAWRWAAAALGSLGLATGVGTYLGAGAGESAHDVPMTLVRRLGLPVGLAGMCVTATTTTLGVLLGGPVGPATPLIAAAVAVVMPRVLGRVEAHVRSWLPEVEVVDVTDLPVV